MKALLLPLAVFATLAAPAQNNPPQAFRYAPGTGLQIYREGVWKKALSDSLATRNSIATLRRGKPGVYRLPQDGMPCLVPDSSKTVRMPNLWPGKKEVPYNGNPPHIPNAARPEFMSYAKRKP